MQNKHKIQGTVKNPNKKYTRDDIYVIEQNVHSRSTLEALKAKGIKPLAGDMNS